MLSTANMYPLVAADATILFSEFLSYLSLKPEDDAV